jgi:hypothetical protein
MRALQIRLGVSMKRSRPLFWSVVAAVAFAGCSIASSSQGKASPSQSDFVEVYRRAHDKHDVEAMRKLYCWDGATSEMKEITERYSYDFEDKIIDIKLTNEHPKERPNQFIKDGVTYGFNLPVVLELLVEYPPPTKGAHNANYYPVGIKDGRYLIAIMVPKGAGQATSSSASTPSQTGQAPKSAQTGETSAAGQPIVVPNETTLTVRLNQIVGVKLISTGGAFSATVSDPVVVNGATVIPAGAAVRGIVSKEGNYSPQLALNSVTVTGTPHRVHTTSSTFNEQIEYPAGTELSFKLVRQLTLQK